MNTATFPETLFTQKMQFEIQSIICNCKTLTGFFFIFFEIILYRFYIPYWLHNGKEKNNIFWHNLIPFSSIYSDHVPQNPRGSGRVDFEKMYYATINFLSLKKTCFKFCAALNSLTLTRGLAPGPHCWWVLQHGSSPRGIFHFPRPQRGQRTLFPRKISNSAEPVNHMAHGNPRGETDDDDDTHIAESHVGAKLRATSVRCGHMDRVPGLLSAACILWYYLG